MFTAVVREREKARVLPKSSPRAKSDGAAGAAAPAVAKAEAKVSPVREKELQNCTQFTIAARIDTSDAMPLTP